jgi:hypothetical protein
MVAIDIVDLACLDRVCVVAGEGEPLCNALSDPGGCTVTAGIGNEYVHVIQLLGHHPSL